MKKVENKLLDLSSIEYKWKEKPINRPLRKPYRTYTIIAGVVFQAIFILYIFLSYQHLYLCPWRRWIVYTYIVLSGITGGFVGMEKENIFIFYTIPCFFAFLAASVLLDVQPITTIHIFILIYFISIFVGMFGPQLLGLKKYLKEDEKTCNQIGE